MRDVASRTSLLDLVLVAIDPRAAGFITDGDEIVVLFPRDEGALGAENVLLPPHLAEVGAGNGCATTCWSS